MKLLMVEFNAEMSQGPQTFERQCPYRYNMRPRHHFIFNKISVKWLHMGPTVAFLFPVLLQSCTLVFSELYI